MANNAECEIRVIEKLIAVFSKTLNCNSSQIDDSEVVVVENVLRFLLSQNETLYSNGEGNGREIIKSIVNESEMSFNSENSTSDTLGMSTVSVEAGVQTSDDRINKLHQLEIIKVFVLIFVISIILLTTCRMVFQLFIRFRPEKPPLA